MPLAGVILPTHAELASAEPGRYPKWLPVPELLDEAQTWGPKESPWPYELLVQAFPLEDDGTTYQSTSISPTFLLNACPRSAIIERNMDYIGLADDFWARVRGSLVHNSLELKARPNSVAEVKFFAEVGGVEVRAIPDLITLDDGGLWDYKFSDNPPMYYPYKSNRRQVELNRYIVNHATNWTYHGDPIDLPFNPREFRFHHLTLNYLGPKGPKPMTIEKKQPFITPKGRKTEKNQPYVSTDAEVEEWLEPLLEIFEIATDAFPKWPKGLEKMHILDTDGKSKIYPFGGGADWRCPGKPICNLPACTAKRYPDGLMWESAL